MDRQLRVFTYMEEYLTRTEHLCYDWSVPVIEPTAKIPYHSGLEPLWQWQESTQQCLTHTLQGLLQPAQLGVVVSGLDIYQNFWEIL